MKLTPEQATILAGLRGPVRIAAGAGTGKTDTLRLAIVELIRRGVRAGEILCLTFTVDATNEVRRRVHNELEGLEGIDPDELTVQTYHAFAASLVREHALLCGLDGDPVLLDDAQKRQLMLEALDRCEFGELELSSVGYVAGKLLDLNEELQRHVLSLDRAAEWCTAHAADEVARKRGEAVRALRCYEAVKRERNAIDFGDQIILAVRLLREHEHVLTEARERFRHLVLDEYQDTDVAQRELVKLIGSGAELVCAVGDVDQGIFGWRGASIHNMFAFPTDFPGATLETLSVNFRSGQEILDLANAIVDRFERPRGEVREPLKAVEGAPGATIEGFVAPHQLEEAEEIARRIEEAGPPWTQYAVLTRRRSEFDPVFHALIARGIPVDVDELGSFWTRPEIIDVVSWLRVLADPGDNLALARLLLGPAYRLSRRDLFFLAERAQEQGRLLRRGSIEVVEYALADAIVEHAEIPELSDEARARVDALRRTWRELAATAERVSLADLVGEIGRVSGLDAELAASPDPAAGVALTHLAKLRDLAQGYQPVEGTRDLGGFVAYLDAVDVIEQQEDEVRPPSGDAVALTTFHGAKGLEWDWVFLVGLAAKVMPSERPPESPPEKWWRVPFELRGDVEFLYGESKAGLERLRDEEERRLMYVGVTRARRRLVLSRAWFYGDNVKPKPPSIFWEEARPFMDVVAECDCPPANPHPLGVETGVPGGGFVELAPDPDAIARIEPELQRLRAWESGVPRAAAWHTPSTLSVTAFLTFVRDPEEFWWRYVRRAPSAPSRAAQLGTELHRRIEQRSKGSGFVPPVEDEEPYDLDVGERRGDGAAVSAEQMWENFQRSRFAQMKPLMTEQPFTLYVGGGLSLEGRIDAIFEREDGVWEVVDYKTGASEPDPLQLAIYARAVEEIWGKLEETAWLLLRTGGEEPAPPFEDIGKVLEDAALALRNLR